MLEPVVFPAVIFGSPATGAGSDNLRKALGKYNVHTHGIAQSPSFFTYPLIRGSEIKELGDITTRLFNKGTTLLSFTDNELIFSSAALRSTNDGKFTLSGVELTELVTTVGSTVVYKSKRPGLVSPFTAKSAATRIFTNSFRTGFPTRNPVLIGSLFNYRISRISFVVKTGKASASLVVEGESPYTFPLEDSTEDPTRIVDFEVNENSNLLVTKNHSLFINFTNIQENTELYYSVFTTDISVD